MVPIYISLETCLNECLKMCRNSKKKMNPVSFSSNIHALFVHLGLHVKQGLTFSQWKEDQRATDNIKVTYISRRNPHAIFDTKNFTNQPIFYSWNCKTHHFTTKIYKKVTINGTF